MQTDTQLSPEHDSAAAARPQSAPHQRGEAGVIIKRSVVTLPAPHSSETYGNFSI